ncbi:MAG: caspase family protein [Spirochaetaceae bacterium]
MKKKLTLITIFLLIATANFSKEPTTKPMLRQNTQIHSSPIKRLDTGGKYLITASLDKTVKLWNAETGEYIRTFRLPIDEGNEGKVFSCAISPDGKTVAVGGWTGWNWYGEAAIYIFDTNTGIMKDKVDGMKSVIRDLEFSKDGKYLGASLAAKAGVQIITTNNWKVYKSLDGYGSDSYNISFDNNGHLATVSFDGNIRLYSKNFVLLKKVKSAGGNKPFNIAFSPDNSKLAIGHNDTSNIHILDSKTLNLLYSPDITGLKSSKKISAVCWSKDGKYLFAGGNHSKVIDGKWWFLIRKYNSKGRGTYTDYKASANTIIDIKPFSEDIIFAGTHPDLGKMDYTGNLSYYKNSEGLSFRNAAFKYLKLTKTSITFKAMGKESVIFDLKEFILKNGDNSGKIYTDNKNGTLISEWEDSYAPKLDNKLISFLRKYEINRCVSITENGSILWGTGWKIYCTDKSGKVIWKKPAPGSVWAVNSIDGIVTAAYSDGTIRWYRLSDGQELMALMVHDDMKRWVLWTPEGYYTASPGGQDLIGWHINNGSSMEADFFSADRFADKFYRPDVLELVLQEKDTQIAIRKANIIRNIKVVATIEDSLPPVVKIITPKNAETTYSKKVNFSVKIKTPNDNPVIETKILLNGRLYEGGERGLNLVSRQGTDKKYSVSLEKGKNNVSFLARNSSGWSEASTVEVNFVSSSIDEDMGFVIKPKLYILAVGVSDYEDSTLKLKYPAKDANDFSNVMKKQEDRIYREVETKLLTNSNATKDNILDGLDWIQKETTSKDVAMIFVAGHGMNDESGYLYYLPQDVNLDRLRRTGLPAEEITRTISSIAGKVIYFMDTCHSGNLSVEGRRGGLVDTTKVVMELTSAENGAVVFASSTGRQYSLEHDKWQNGAFTKALVEGLSGKADYTGKGKISINMLDLYLSERVKELTNGSQTPTTAKPDTIRDFPLAIK